MKNPADQAAKPGNDKRSSRLKLAIIILAVLLLLSAGGLAVRYIYLNFFAPTQATVTVPDNLIGEEPEPSPSETSGASSETAQPESGQGTTSTPVSGGETASRDPAGGTTDSGSTDKPQAAKLELYQGKPGDNQKFEVRNMLPGDSVTQYFCMKASHDQDVDLFFRADVTEQTKSLGDVLHIKVTHLDTGKVLCDTPFSEIDGQEFSELLAKNAQGETVAYYRIDVSLDTSVSNEYQAAMLQSDFEWYVKDEGELTPPPQTGDTTNIVLWAVLALSSLLLILLLLITKRRKRDEQHG